MMLTMLDMKPYFMHRFRLDLASLSIMEKGPRGTSLALLNDTHHLNGLAI